MYQIAQICPHTVPVGCLPYIALDVNLAAPPPTPGQCWSAVISHSAREELDALDSSAALTRRHPPPVHLMPRLSSALEAEASRRNTASHEQKTRQPICIRRIPALLRQAPGLPHGRTLPYDTAAARVAILLLALLLDLVASDYHVAILVPTSAALPLPRSLHPCRGGWSIRDGRHQSAGRNRETG